MTYRSKRTRADALAADTDASQSLPKKTTCPTTLSQSYSMPLPSVNPTAKSSTPIPFVSVNPAKNSANNSSGPMPKVSVETPSATNGRWGPFTPKNTSQSPTSTTAKDVQSSPQVTKPGIIWKKPPVGPTKVENRKFSPEISSKDSLSGCSKPLNAPENSSPLSHSTHQLPKHVAATNLPTQQHILKHAATSNPATSQQQFPKHPSTLGSFTSQQQAPKHASSSKCFTSQQPPRHVSKHAAVSVSPNSDEKNDVAGTGTLAATHQDNHPQKKSDAHTTKNSKPRKRQRLEEEWPDNVEFDDKEEVLTIRPDGTYKLVTGSIQPIDVWNSNGVRYCVEFNEYHQPLYKGGHILVRFIGSIAKDDRYCPIVEDDWRKVKKYNQTKILKEIRDRFVIPPDWTYDKLALQRADKCWRQYKHSLKLAYFKPNEISIQEIVDVVPSGVNRSNWTKLVEYWASDKGKKLAENGKHARALQNQAHTMGSTSYANVRAEYESKHGKEMSLLELWEKTHKRKDGSFLEGRDTEDFLGDVYARAGTLKLNDESGSKSQVEIENEAFNYVLYGGDIPDRPQAYGFGVRKNDIYGPQAELRKEGYLTGHTKTKEMETVKVAISDLSKQNEELKKQNEQLKDKVEENTNMMRTVTSQFSQLLDVIHSGKASPQLLLAAKLALSKANPEFCGVDLFEVVDRRAKLVANERSDE